MKLNNLRTAAALLFISVAASMFWLAAPAYSGIVGAKECTVCHKQVTTYMFMCNSLDYRRHKDHGDPDGACPASQ